LPSPVILWLLSDLPFDPLAYPARFPPTLLPPYFLVVSRVLALALVRLPLLPTLRTLYLLCHGPPFLRHFPRITDALFPRRWDRLYLLFFPSPSLFFLSL